MYTHTLDLSLLKMNTIRLALYYEEEGKMGGIIFTILFQAIFLIILMED